jgi:hypothetical protein
VLSLLRILALLAPAASVSPEASFWEWFLANTQRLQTIHTGHEPVAEELARQLQRINGDLTWEVSTANESPRELVISAGGIRAAFPSVQKLVAAQPFLPGWKIVAFRPRRNAALSVSFGSYELKPSAVWFSSEPDGQKLGLTLFIPGFVEGDNTATQAAYLLLDGALGEYDVETKVGFIQLKRAPPDPAKQGLKPFAQLPAVVDASVK